MENKDNSPREQSQESQTPKTDQSYVLDEDPSRLAQVEQIIDFYKDKPDPEKKVDVAKKESDIKQTLPDRVRTLYNKMFKSKPVVSAKSHDGEEIHDSAYGINKKGRIIVTYAITAALCAAIIGGSFLLAAILPGNKEETDRYAETLRAQDDYTTLKADYDKLYTETEELRTQVADKKERSENIDDYENTQAELRTKIEDKKKELDSTNSEISEKQSQLDSIDDQILQHSDNITTLPPGRYVVGEDIAAGKYTVTGTGTFAVASEDKTSKYNTTLGSSPYEVTLNQGDRLKFDSTVKFTPNR